MIHRFRRCADNARWGVTPCTVLALGASLVVLPGCAEENDRLTVRGTVTFEGQSLADGNVLFRPLGAGQTAGAKIEQGKFQVHRDKGLLPGKYRVEIKAMRNIGELYIDSASGQQEQDREQFIPPKYNTKSELAIEVTPDGDNTFSFEITKDPE